MVASKPVPARAVRSWVAIWVGATGLLLRLWKMSWSAEQLVEWSASLFAMNGGMVMRAFELAVFGSS